MILVIKHIDIEGLGNMEKPLSGFAGLNIIDLSKGDLLPSDLSDIKAVISLGGPMNVYEEDKLPFLKDEDRLLKEALRNEIPFLGVCLGAQLLAKASGAKVFKAKIKEIGWYEVNLTEEGRKDPLFCGLPEELKVFQWHEDTFDIPPEGALLAGSRACSNQAFRVGENAYGLQFHLEVTVDMIESWIARYKGSADLNGTKNYVCKTEKQIEMLCANFNKMIKQRYPF